MRATRYKRGWRSVLLPFWLAVQAVPGCRPEEGAPTQGVAADTASSWFTDVTEASGLDFVYDPGPFNHRHMPQITGSGVALIDLDNDGDLDLYFTNGHADLPALRGDGRITNRYFRQETDGRFVDATDASGLGDAGYGMGVAVGDIDNDGDRDVYVTNYGPDRLFRNRGDGTFEDITESAGVDLPGWSCSAAMLDYDRDGYLDVYVTHYLDFDPTKKCWDPVGRSDFCGPTSFPPVHDVLLHNNGDATFTDVSEQAGLHDVPPGAGLGVVCADFNDDGWIDVYVANDGHANNLWVNQKDGTFDDEGAIVGAAYNLNGHAEAGMGVLAADFDRDLMVDIFVTHLYGESNTLYRNLGNMSGYVDATAPLGLEQSSMSVTGFGVAAFDVELDGDLDILIANGAVSLTAASAGDAPVVRPSQSDSVGRSDRASVPAQWAAYAEPNLLYLREGEVFRRSQRAPAITGPVEVSRGLSVGDLDYDGDLDVVITQVQSLARLYRCHAPRVGSWFIVYATDPVLRRDAIGAVVVVNTPTGAFRQDIASASGYLSAKEPVAHFGLGATDVIDHVEIRWPDGDRERFTGIAPNSVVRLTRGDGRSVAWAADVPTNTALSGRGR